MRIDIRETDRTFRGRAELNHAERPATIADPESGQPIPLKWEKALDSEGRIVRCIVCGCRDLFRRRDFPQGLGLSLVVVAGIASVILFAFRLVMWSIIVLAAVVVIDALIWFFTRQCIVCYRCRSEYRGVDINPEIEPWELAIGEKYRPIRQAGPVEPIAPQSSRD